jgi:hypothetical protein
MSRSTLARCSLMRLTLVHERFHRGGWVYEEKCEGWRMVALKDGSSVRLVSRHGVDHSSRFSAVAQAIAKLPGRSLVLDGLTVCVCRTHARRCDKPRIVWYGGCAVILLLALVHTGRAVRTGRSRPAAVVVGVIAAAVALVTWSVLMGLVIDPLMMRGGHR